MLVLPMAAGAQTLAEGTFSREELYHRIDSVVGNDAGHRPVIGVSGAPYTATSGARNEYLDAIILAGGVPVILPVTHDPVVMNRALDVVDGVLVTGGEDVHPQLYGEEPDPRLGTVSLYRDYSDLLLLHLAVARRKAVLGICRGAQLLNVSLGGTLIQDIPSAKGTSAVGHLQKMGKDVPSHSVSIVFGSRMEKLLGKGKILVNSFHHQCIDQLADGLRVTATAPDGVPEAVEGTDGKLNVVGVQFHPEGMAAGSEAMLSIFKDLLERTKK